MEKKMIVPPADVFETGDKYVLVMDMPGADKDKIEVTAENDKLSIKASAAEVNKEWEAVSSEFALGDYYREFSIGHTIDRSKIDAKYDNGVLTVELGKSEQAKPRKIEVKLN